MKKSMILFCLFSQLLKGQTTFNVQDNFGYKYLELTNVLPTDSCYYVNGIVRDTSNQQNQIGSIFMKFDLAGDTLLTKKLIVPSKNYRTWHSGLIAASDGGLMGAGESSDSIEKVFIVKYTPTGDTQFIREFVHPNYPPETFITADALVGVGGHFYLVGGYKLAGALANQIVAFKLDQSGNLIQQRTYGGNTPEIVASALPGPDSGLIIGASRNNFNQVWQGFYSRTYIFGVDSLGEVLWEYQSPMGQLQDVTYSMVLTPDGGLVAASARGIETEDSPGVGFVKWHGYIFKLNANHQFVWGREMRGTRRAGSPSFCKILPANDGGGFVAYGNVGEDKSFGVETYGSWLVKVSNQGDSLWARYYTFVEGIGKYYKPMDLKSTPDGGYVVAGQLQDGQQALGWLMKLDSFGCLVPGCNANDGPNATGEAQKAGLRLAIYPNPTADFLNFYVASPFPITIGVSKEGAQFRILNEAGQVVREFRASTPGDTFIVPVRDWAAGVYFLQYMVEGRAVATERFVVQGR